MYMYVSVSNIIFLWNMKGAEESSFKTRKTNIYFMILIYQVDRKPLVNTESMLDR